MPSRPILLSGRSPFLLLQLWQAATTLHHEVPPPRARGFTWSKVRDWELKWLPQYWHEKRSLRKMLRRVKAGCFLLWFT